MNLNPEIVETLLTRCSIQILASHEYTSADKSSLFALNRLFEAYLKTILQRALAFARTNKRAKVNYDDIELSFFMESISLQALEHEMMRLNNNDTRHDEVELSTSQDKVARGFESVDKKIQANLLGPELNGRARGVPDYMEKGMMLPNLPPLYTHHKTPVFADRVRGGLEIRQGVTRESTLIETSLRKIIEMEESTGPSKTKTEEDDDDDDDDNDKDMSDRERVTDVMLSRVTTRERQKRQRERMFGKVWQEMGFGQVTSGRAVNWEQTSRQDSSDSSMTSRRVVA